MGLVTGHEHIRNTTPGQLQRNKASKTGNAAQIHRHQPIVKAQTNVGPIAPDRPDIALSGSMPHRRPHNEAIRREQKILGSIKYLKLSEFDLKNQMRCFFAKMPSCIVYNHHCNWQQLPPKNAASIIPASEFFISPAKISQFETKMPSDCTLQKASLPVTQPECRSRIAKFFSHIVITISVLFYCLFIYPKIIHALMIVLAFLVETCSTLAVPLIIVIGAILTLTAIAATKR